MIDVPVQVKDALRDGRLRKNYRFVVLNEDGTPDETIGTIDNDYLVSESVNIDERMCSGDTLKFGLCEGSSLEFQYFGKPNITGKRVQAFIDVDYGEAEPYTIPMGFFDVKKCSRQASTGIIKVTAYNKLQSDYLDAKANTMLEAEFSNPTDTVTLFDIKNVLLNHYEITEDYDPLPITEFVQGVGHRKLSTSRFSFRATYGIESPINYLYYNLSYSGTESNLFYMYLDDFKASITADPSKVYRFKIDGIDLNAYEDQYWEKILTEITKSVNITREQLISLLTSVGPTPAAGYSPWLGYQTFLGLEIVFNDNENYDLCTRHYYSKYAYQYGISNVLGSLLDASKKSFSNVREIIVHTPNTFTISETANDFSKHYASYQIYSVEDKVFMYYTTEYNTTKTGHAYHWFYIDDTKVDEAFYRQNIKVLEYEDLPPASQVSFEIDAIPDFTLRDITTAIFETECQFGQLSRLTDLFSGVELNHSSLYPADTLYPENSLYPDGAQASSFRSQYSKLWADEGNVHKWRNLIITYKGLDEQGNEKEYTLQRQVNADGTDDYNCSDNWLFRNLVWTSEQVAQYAEAMVAKMQPITWFPFEMWGAGLPYIETGDQIEIPLGEETYTSYILQRNLKGIQNLQDTYINGTLDIF